jgi:2,3-bisphosphoglycerate-independent phosphoglycerate mutase
MLRGMLHCPPFMVETTTAKYRLPTTPLLLAVLVRHVYLRGTNYFSNVLRGDVELGDISTLKISGGDSILLLVLDGLGGLPREAGGPTELEAARTPNFDALAQSGDLGLHLPVGRGITPGSGPGHLSLFGYDPLQYRIGRGVLEALGIEFDLRPGDIAIRGNLCSVDDAGIVVDRRAGRISSEAAKPVCEALDQIEVEGARIFVQCVKEHRVLIVVRPDEPSGASVADTDPGRVGFQPSPVRSIEPDSEPAARAIRAWLECVPGVLGDGDQANMVLLRGSSQLPDWPEFPDVFGLRSLAIAAYPMYRGVARLVGMEAIGVPEGPEHLVTALAREGAGRDFAFVHVKAPDKAGEDGDFDRKVAVIEEVDAVVPELLAAFPGVCLVTGDHSTPATMKAHSWHSVPFLMNGGHGCGGSVVSEFGETACRQGSLGLLRGCELMPLAMARAGRLSKFGA